MVSVRNLAGLGESEVSDEVLGVRFCDVPNSCQLDGSLAGFLPTVDRSSAVAFASCCFLKNYSLDILTFVRRSELNTED